MTDEEKSPTGQGGAEQKPSDQIDTPSKPNTQDVDNELAALLDETVAAFEKHVSLVPGAATAKALWVVFAHTIESASFAPRLALVSPEEGCGKTIALAVLSQLVPDPIIASNASVAVIYRFLKLKTFTLIFDEADTFMDGKPEFVNIYNSGHVRTSAYVLRCGSNKDNFQPEQYPTFCPMIIARIGELAPATVASRSIIIPMLKRKADETLSPITSADLKRLGEIKNRCAMWAKKNCAKLQDARPKMPDGFSDRCADNWRHLIAIADLAGPEWGQRARKAALSLEAEPEISMGVRVLEAIRQVFDEQNVSKIPSEKLADDPALQAHTGTKWNQNTLAAVLRPFGIRPKSVRIGNHTPKGYERSQFIVAWERFPKPRTSQGDGESA
jgi:hypothetical protein